MPEVDTWDPAQYNRFAVEREQPFWDLAHLLAPVDVPHVVDLGCGLGEDLRDQESTLEARGLGVRRAHFSLTLHRRIEAEQLGAPGHD